MVGPGSSCALAHHEDLATAAPSKDPWPRPNTTVSIGFRKEAKASAVRAALEPLLAYGATTGAHEALEQALFGAPEPSEIVNLDELSAAVRRAAPNGWKPGDAGLAYDAGQAVFDRYKSNVPELVRRALAAPDSDRAAAFAVIRDEAGGRSGRSLLPEWRAEIDRHRRWHQSLR